MTLLKIAAFSDGDRGGNPAGVLIADAHPTADEMRRIAAEVGYSETAFAMPQGDAWQVRFFSPESEVPFCGHATIALGATFAGYLRDLDWPHQGSIEIVQGEDMGMPSRLWADIPPAIRVAGTARIMEV